MPIWSEILKELHASAQTIKGPQGTVKVPNFDGVRRGYLGRLQQHEKRNTVLYASGWLQKNTDQSETAITDEDIHGLMEVTAGLRGGNLDLILHSPGGSPEAAEGVVSYLRSRFQDIRVIVPHMAMSAATMISCAANEIVMGNHSFLGPIDPQLIVVTPLGRRFVPAQSVLDQFEMAKDECQDPTKLAAWLSMLAQYGPDLLVQCERFLDLSRDLVQTWLARYMFNGMADGGARAQEIAEWLSNHALFKTHNRHLPRAELQKRGLKVVPLEGNRDFQDLVLSVFHATTHTFSGTQATKIIENHLGRAFIKQQQPPPAPPGGSIKIDLTQNPTPPNRNPGPPN